MGQYLIDNNVISHYFSNALSENGMKFVAEIMDQIPKISVITEIEALSWLNPDKTKERIIQEFINDANVLALTPAIVKRCIALRRNRKIKTPDSIIAATAIVHNLILLTSDRHFSNIQELQVLDPQTL
jgi:predicted nucleic acid-binding protein